jgi:hypothetical protein
MKSVLSRWIIAVIVVLSVIAIGLYVFSVFRNKLEPAPIVTEEKLSVVKSVIGNSVEERNIEAYTYGNGKTHLVFVGGIHGGYEWNSVLLSYKFMDYLAANPQFISSDITVTVIPSLNPDGIYEVVNKEGRFNAYDVVTNLPNGTGRFNANNVDLNRNFDCKWQATSTWKSNVVSAGTAAFSEPEAKAFRNYILQSKPAAVIFWHSMSNTVYGSDCGAGIMTETKDLMNTYSLASDYKMADTFDSYVVTGDASDWLASIKIPAITVELKTHESIEWDKNLAGIKALFEYYKNK